MRALSLVTASHPRSFLPGGILLLGTVLLLCASPVWAQANAIVFQTDFGEGDGAVASMKGVAFSVDRGLPMFDLTHEIPPFNIWEAAYRLSQTAAYWPKGTVFVSVVDPGVGTDRKSVVMKAKSGHFFVTPDNGTLTLVADKLGIAEIRQIDEPANRLSGSKLSHTFHGRDVYAYTGARLAAGIVPFPKIGPKLPKAVVSIPYQTAAIEDDILHGTIPILDSQFGNVWTDIGHELLADLGASLGDWLCVRVSSGRKVVYTGKMPYVRSFGAVPKREPLLYLNSLLNVSLALNWDSFAARHHIESGPDWRVHISRCLVSGK